VAKIVHQNSPQMNRFARTLGMLFASGLCVSTIGTAIGADRRPQLTPPQELVSRQIPPVVQQDVLARLDPQNAAVVVSLARQRAYVYAGSDLAIDTPISSGKRAGMTPAGDFTILQKDRDHRSSVYGNFVDSRGRVIRSGVSSRIDSAPSGTHFVGAPMLYFMRLTWEGVGMHVGILPGYPASHGCIRMPAEIPPMIYPRVKIGTRVQVTN
jgi:lipoprotein-anchoring transpeptidase ErfK/SrfK